MNREENQVKLLKWSGQITLFEWTINHHEKNPPSWWSSLSHTEVIHIVFSERKALKKMKKLYNELLTKLTYKL